MERFVSMYCTCPLFPLTHPTAAQVDNIIRSKSNLKVNSPAPGEGETKIH